MDGQARLFCSSSHASLLVEPVLDRIRVPGRIQKPSNPAFRSTGSVGLFSSSGNIGCLWQSQNVAREADARVAGYRLRARSRARRQTVQALGFKTYLPAGSLGLFRTASNRLDGNAQILVTHQKLHAPFQGTQIESRKL